MRLVEQGRFSEAMNLYALAESEGELSERDLIAFGEELTRRGEVEGALGVFRSYLRRYPQGSYRLNALLMTGLLYLYGKRQPAYAYRYITAVLESDPKEPIRRQALEAMREIDRFQKFKIRGR